VVIGEHPDADVLRAGAAVLQVESTPGQRREHEERSVGYEYQLQFTHPGAAAVAEVVRRLPFAHERQPQSGEFELWIDGPNGGMPDAAAQVEPYGLYFCYYGVAGRELLGTLLARLVSEFGAVTIDDLEP
jgi:hypothetical protein